MVWLGGMAVRMVQKKLGWKEVGDDDDWQVYWTDTSVALERIMRLKPTQKINHFTGMLEICRKKVLPVSLRLRAPSSTWQTLTWVWL